jgi:hypothetical protein
MSRRFVSERTAAIKKLVAEAQGQFGNPEEGECMPMEAVTRRLVKTQQDEKT